MRSFVTIKPKALTSTEPLDSPDENASSRVEADHPHEDPDPDRENAPEAMAPMLGYESDWLDDSPIDEIADEIMTDNEEGVEDGEESRPRRTRRALETSVQEARRIAREKRRKELEAALKAIEAVIKSRKTQWAGGEHGLQAHRARAIRSYFQLVVRKNYGGVEASIIAAESHGFAKLHGSRLIRQWGNEWIKTQDLPTSKRGCHPKVASLLEDPDICAEIRSYLRSNKWATNPRKFAEFSAQKMLPKEADKYLKQITEKEMPRALKRHLELEIFPRIHMKVGRGISVSTARRWMHREGFQYMAYKKALYYDGHERPDVVHYRQNVFLPAMEKYRERLVEYQINNVMVEVIKQLPPGVRKLVLCAHDESTMQTNDGPKAGWGPKDEQPLLKKGPGRGSHRSDVICSTVGWLKEAGQQLEYGKNYDGYWTGALFVKQVSCEQFRGFNFMLRY